MDNVRRKLQTNTMNTRKTNLSLSSERLVETDIQWVCWSRMDTSDTRGRAAWIMLRDRIATYGRRTVLTYQTRKNSRSWLPWHGNCILGILSSRLWCYEVCGWILWSRQSLLSTSSGRKWDKVWRAPWVWGAGGGVVVADPELYIIYFRS